MKTALQDYADRTWLLRRKRTEIKSSLIIAEAFLGIMLAAFVTGIYQHLTG
jgi:hypothetical protein